MRFEYLKSAVLGVICLMVLGPVACVAQEIEVEEEDVWVEDEPAARGPRFEMTDEMADKMLERIAETDPARAKELTALREENPQQFQREMRNVMREHFRQQMGERRQDRPERFGAGQGPRGLGEMQMGEPGKERWRQRQPGRATEGPGVEMMRERLREKHKEYLEWLEQNYADEAQELEKIHEEHPEHYMRRIGVSLKRYGRIFQASKDNPELAEVLKENFVLKQRRHELLKQIGQTTDETQKKALTDELNEVVAQRFDLIVRRKHLAYEELARKLEELQKEVKAKEAEVAEWTEPQFKREHVKTRVEELLSETEKFEWDE